MTTLQMDREGSIIIVRSPQVRDPLRRALVQSGQRGSAAAIQQGLQQQGIEPIPSLRTIYRILQRHEQEAI
jgi:hypothetical protein